MTDGDNPNLKIVGLGSAASGKYELFKTCSHYDGTAHNPQWLG